MSNNPPLTLLEEFLLLAFDEQNGQLRAIDSGALDKAVAGAVLMDLTLRNRIDNDQRDLFPVDPTPTGDELLDPILKTMSKAPVLTPQPIDYWVAETAKDGASLRSKALRRLESRGALRHRGFGMFWAFGGFHHLSVDEQKLRDIRSRLMSTIYGDDVPSPRNIMLIALVDSCGLFGTLLNETEMRDAQARIEKISRMDMIGQAVAKKSASGNS